MVDSCEKCEIVFWSMLLSRISWAWNGSSCGKISSILMVCFNCGLESVLSVKEVKSVKVLKEDHLLLGFHLTLAVPNRVSSTTYHPQNRFKLRNIVPLQ